MVQPFPYQKHASVFTGVSAGLAGDVFLEKNPWLTFIHFFNSKGSLWLTRRREI